MDVLSVIGMSTIRDRLTELVRRVRELRLDLNEYVCLKYILLLNPGLLDTVSQTMYKKMFSSTVQILHDIVFNRAVDVTC